MLWLHVMDTRRINYLIPIRRAVLGRIKGLVPLAEVGSSSSSLSMDIKHNL